MRGLIILGIAQVEDGPYEASVTDLRALGQLDGSSQGGGPGLGGGGGLLAATGVREGIDWGTLKFVERRFLNGKADNGKSFQETGGVWTVQTVAGHTITLYNADPLNKQPPATQKLVEDPSFNCHGWSFSATGIVSPDGQTRSFQIVQDSDAKTILNDAYKQISAKDAAALHGGTKLLFAFENAKGEVIHTATNWWPARNGYEQQYAFDPRDNTFIETGTFVSSKNGDNNLLPSVSVLDVWRVYSDKKRDAANRAVIVNLYTLK